MKYWIDGEDLNEQFIVKKIISYKFSIKGTYLFGIFFFNTLGLNELNLALRYLVCLKIIISRLLSSLVIRKISRRGSSFVRDKKFNQYIQNIKSLVADKMQNLSNFMIWKFKL